MINNYNNNHYNYYFRENINKIINTFRINQYNCIDDNNDLELIYYYKNYRLLERIVDIDNINLIHTIKKHVTSLLVLSDNRLASCSKR